MSDLVVICGPTATGKTSLAIKLCQKLNGEIVSADSRQIYKFMDIGTGKLPIKTQSAKLKAQNLTQNSKLEIKKGDGYWIIDSVYIHLYDLVEPDKKFSVARFKDAAIKEIQSMWRRKKVPFLVGGTGFYIAAVLGEAEFPRVAPSGELRHRLEKLSREELYEKLKELDPARAKTVDAKNPRRLIRAVEIAAVGDSPERGPECKRASLFSSPAAWPQITRIGLTAPREVLYHRADAWADSTVNNGLLGEVKDLINRGYKNAPPLTGIIYQTAVSHLDGKISKEEMLRRIKFDLHGYIRRQLTWFKRDQEIRWFDITQPNFDLETEEMVESLLKDA